MRNKQNNCGFVLKFLQYIYFLIYYFKTQTKLIHTHSYIDLLFMCGHKRYLTCVCVHVCFCVRVCMCVCIYTHTSCKHHTHCFTSTEICNAVYSPYLVCFLIFLNILNNKQVSKEIKIVIS